MAIALRQFVAVTTHSIRYRILKAPLLIGLAKELLGYNPFDPIQDTESLPIQPSPGVLSFCYNPFDPIQDTERSM